MGRLEEQAWEQYYANQNRTKDRDFAQQQEYQRRLLAQRQQENDIMSRQQLQAMQGKQQLALAGANNDSQEFQNQQRGYYQTALAGMQHRAALDQGLQSWGKARDLEGLRGQLDMQKMEADYGFRDKNAENAAQRQQAMYQDQQIEGWLQEMGQKSQRFDPASQKAWSDIQTKLQEIEREYQQGSLQGRPDQRIAARQKLIREAQAMKFNEVPNGMMPGDITEAYGMMYRTEADGTRKEIFGSIDPDKAAAQIRSNILELPHGTAVRAKDGSVKFTPNPANRAGSRSSTGMEEEPPPEFNWDEAYQEAHDRISKDAQTAAMGNSIGYGKKPMPSEAAIRAAVMREVQMKAAEFNQRQQDIQRLRNPPPDTSGDDYSGMTNIRTGKMIPNDNRFIEIDPDVPDNSSSPMPNRLGPAQGAPAGMGQGPMGGQPQGGSQGQAMMQRLIAQAQASGNAELSQAASFLVSLQNRFPGGIEQMGPQEKEMLNRAMQVIRGYTAGGR